MLIIPANARVIYIGKLVLPVMLSGWPFSAMLAD